MENINRRLGIKTGIMGLIVMELIIVDFQRKMSCNIKLVTGAGVNIDNLLNAAVNTGVASAGYAENLKDFGTNLIKLD